jgi:glutaredoxin
MATCACGNKRPFTASKCPQCVAAEKAEIRNSLLNEIESKQPELHRWIAKFDIKIDGLTKEHLASLPDKSVEKIKACLPGASYLFLTDSYILKMRIGFLDAKVVSLERIPFEKISGIDARKPYQKTNGDFEIWNLVINRGGVDELFSVHGKGEIAEFVDLALASMKSKGNVGSTNAATSEFVEKLEALAKLRDQGILTSEEFESKKTELLRGI